ncbi:uncharacterized protein LOC121387967 [Gigantopelta aegis]|uniref:uncharacterized protein LOC121387967 n=1 Tax=Gigantopelta aegis TaxID=1735272 RepID=UPI001B88B24F|nr:uncharacterized protein LOC121387967 [Gigantopelta aegis]
MNTTEKEIETLKKVHFWFWAIGGPLIFIPGVIGNVIAMWIFRKLKIKSSCASLHLFVLSVTDTAVLFTNLGRLWIKYTFKYDLRDVCEAGCKIHQFLSYTFMDFSGWILVSLACERCIHVTFPFRFKSWCTIRKTAIKLVVLFLVICGINAHHLAAYGLVQKNNRSECAITMENISHYDKKIFPWIDLSVLSLVPFVIMLTCSVIITRKLRQSGLVFIPELNIVVMRGPQQSNMAGVDRYSSETRLLLTLAILYVFLSLPYAITNPIDTYLLEECGVCNARWRLAWTITYLIQFCNYAVNTICYRLRDKKFNKEFLKLIRCRPSRNRNSLGTTSTTFSRHHSYYSTSLGRQSQETGVDEALNISRVSYLYTARPEDTRYRLKSSRQASNSTSEKQNSAGETQNSASEKQNSAGETQNSAGETQNSASEKQNSAGETQNSAGETQNSAGDTQNSAGETQNSVDETQNSGGETQNSPETQNSVDETQKSAGETENSAGETLNSAGETQNCAGETQNSVGETLNSAGETQNSAGDTQNSAGETQNSDGETQNSDGETQNSSGETQYSAGETQNSACETQNSAGETQNSACKTQNSAGETHKSSGERQNNAIRTEKHSNETHTYAGQVEDSCCETHHSETHRSDNKTLDSAGEEMDIADKTTNSADQTMNSDETMNNADGIMSRSGEITNSDCVYGNSFLNCNGLAFPVPSAHVDLSSLSTTYISHL